MSATATEQQQIIQGDAVALWLKDASVQACIARVRADITAQWTLGKTPADREAQFAKMDALNALLQEFASTIQNGKVARIKQEKASQQYAGKKPGTR